ncbi:hypothetical protein KDW_34190 [Dictyobacter vulcani]|uniref:DUF1800 domain-containing protein n=1 Tax=Dictyobacter vulcani TaxID=2607529 RepID=A0A5J4KS82_9CHLR|nr:DUF1800 domain-containing protein [Dictyobacter vulcani]GER89257.1 hypothetical protein KDW_34190 [Dictyobacter vulcani]
MDIHDQPTEPWKDNEGAPAGFVSGNVVTSASKSGRISRRALFTGLAGAGAAVAVGGVALAEWQQSQSNPNSIPGAQSGSVANAQIGHLLRRAGFGGRIEDLAFYNSLGYEGAVDHLLNYQRISDQTLEQRLSAAKLDLNKAPNQQRWWLLRMIDSQRPLQEKMTLFWHGMLTSNYQKVGGPKVYTRMIVQNNFLRAHAFDTFDNILLGITSDPAMLFYLDLTRSRKNAPNENYARELMELFTLGLGHYTQADVSAAAAALTGWHIKGGTLEAQYNPRDHSNKEITFLGHTGNLNYKDVIQILTNHPAAAAFLCRKLFTFFVYENPSNEDLAPLIDTYNKSNHNVGAVMKTLLLSPQFRSDKAYRARVKSPTEFVVGVYRALDAKTDGKELPAQTIIQGQTLFGPPNVAGWPGDKVSATWLNGGTWLSRLNYLNLLIAGGRSRTSVYKPFDFQSNIDKYKIDTPEAFVTHFANFLLDGALDDQRKAQLVSYFTIADPRSRQGHVTLVNGKSYP